MVGCFEVFLLLLLTTVKRLFKTSCARILDTKCDRLCRCTVLSLLIQIESEHSNLFSKSNQSLHCSFLFQLSFPKQVLLTTLLHLLYSKVSTAIRCVLWSKYRGLKNFKDCYAAIMCCIIPTYSIPVACLQTHYHKYISLHITLGKKTSPLLSQAKHLK